MKDHLIQAFSTVLPKELPDEIQWMPPGRHDITAWVDGEPKRLTVSVNAATAERMQRALMDFQAKAAAGLEDKPYLDFNHEDAAASGHITAFSWGGDDPVKGGVRARVEWTEPGKAALQGRAYRRFSPSFTANAKGEVTGAPLNMGGLVNRAAFKSINPIWASDGSQVTNKNTQMENDKELADLKTANAELRKQIEQLQSQLSASKSEAEVKAKDAKITELETKITTLENAAKEQLKVDAKAAVAEAVKAGKIPSQNTDLQGHYEGIYVASPEAGKAILASLPANPALQPVTPTSGGQPTGGQPGEHEFMVKARAAAAERKVTVTEATTLVAAEQPQLYAAYCDSLKGK